MLACATPPAPVKKARRYYGCVVNKDSGSYNTFFVFTHCKRKGFKTFRSKFYAYCAFRRQQILAEHNLAPRVYGTICRMTRIENGQKSKTAWGYVTEIVKMPTTEQIRKLRSYRYLLKKTNDLAYAIRQVPDMHQQYFCDNHLRNIGWAMRGGRRCWMCIDAGCEGFSSKTEFKEIMENEFRQIFNEPPYEDE
jgi:hypothetical protein